MNQKERYQIMVKTREFKEGFEKLKDDYYSAVEGQKDADQEKKNNLLPQFTDATIADTLQEHINSLDSVLTNLDAIQESVDNVDENIELDFHKKRNKKIDKINVAALALPSKGVCRKEGRTARVQIVIPPSLLLALRSYALDKRLSVNEIINRLLEKHLQIEK